MSIEELDSALFGIAGLVDYRVAFDGQLTIEARTLGEAMETQILGTAKAMYPDFPMRWIHRFAGILTALCT